LARHGFVGDAAEKSTPAFHANLSVQVQDSSKEIAVDKRYKGIMGKSMLCLITMRGDGLPAGV